MRVSSCVMGAEGIRRWRDLRKEQPALRSPLSSPFDHVPVLADAVLAGLEPLAELLATRPGGGPLIDCTLGGG
ncbi:MAG: hypothetical protein ACKOPT_05925, partial [Cyanobium sp.]